MLLRIEHLSKDYGRFRALDDLCLEVAPGEVFGLLGPNGSGKTTTLRLVLGFLRPSAGRATVGGHDCWSDGVAARRLLAYLPGELRLYDNMTGRQFVRFLARLRGQADDGVDELARRFDVDLDRPLASLSSGMKRKVALVQVLATRAPLLIMDEPSNALDPTMRGELLAQVRRARERGQAVVFSSHVLAEVEAVCDRVAVLRQGRLVHLQSLFELRQGRLLHVHFHGAREPLPAFPGLRVLDRGPDWLTLEHTGDLTELLAWLGRQPLADLRLGPLGLEPIYRRYHPGESGEEG